MGFLYQHRVKTRGNDPYAYARQSLGYFQSDIVLGGIFIFDQKMIVIPVQIGKIKA